MKTYSDYEIKTMIKWKTAIPQREYITNSGLQYIGEEDGSLTLATKKMNEAGGKSFSVASVIEVGYKNVVKAIKGNALLTTLLAAAIIGAIGAAWRNADPPFVKAQIEKINTIVTNHIEKEDVKDNKMATDYEVLKNNVSNTNAQVNVIADEQVEQRKLLIQILLNSKQIKENTK